jgi:hypothetical protein
MPNQKLEQGSKINKIEAVKRAMDQLGDDAPAVGIIAYVKKHFGMDMKKNHASANKSKILQARETKKPTAAPAKPVAAAAPPAPKKPTKPVAQPQKQKAPAAPMAASASNGSNGINLDDIQAVKALVQRVGVDTLHKLLGLLGG